MRYQGNACGGQAINPTPLTSDRLSNKIFPGPLLSTLVGEGAKEIFFGVLTTLRKRMEVPADSPPLALSGGSMSNLMYSGVASAPL